MAPLTVFVGYDSREVAAYDVACHSLRARASVPVEVVPLKLGEPPVSDWLSRPVERRDGKMWCPISEAPMATEFAVSRFCVPFLRREGWALFADCDVLFRADVAELFALADPRYAVQVVKHEQPVKPGETKMDGCRNDAYARKNWSSLCLWNCSHRAHGWLTRATLNCWPGRNLHAFRWLEDHEIGSLPPGWNHLVGVDDPAGAAGAKLLHYTLGSLWLPGWKGGPLDDVWAAERAAMKERAA